MHYLNENISFYLLKTDLSSKWSMHALTYLKCCIIVYGSKECLMLHKWYEHFFRLSMTSLLSCWNLCMIIKMLPLLLSKSIPILCLICVQRITSMRRRSLEPSWQSRVRNNVVWSISNHLMHAWQLLAVLLLPLERGWGQCANACTHTPAIKFVFTHMIVN